MKKAQAWSSTAALVMLLLVSVIPEPASGLILNMFDPFRIVFKNDLKSPITVKCQWKFYQLLKPKNFPDNTVIKPGRQLAFQLDFVSATMFLNSFTYEIPCKVKHPRMSSWCFFRAYQLAEADKGACEGEGCYWYFRSNAFYRSVPSRNEVRKFDYCNEWWVRPKRRRGRRSPATAAATTATATAINTTTATN